MNDVIEVSDRVAAMYLGRVVADVPVTETTTREFLVELITSGRSGSVGMRQAESVDGTKATQEGADV